MQSSSLQLINDPSLMGWLICVAYISASILSIRICKLFWVLLGSALLFLGINKQLDLHTKSIALLTDFNGSKGILITAAVLSVIVCLILAPKIGRLIVDSGKLAILTTSCMAALIVSLAIRYSSIPSVSELMTTHIFTEEDGLLHIHLVELIELGFVVLISVLIWKQQRRSSQANAENRLE